MSDINFCNTKEQLNHLGEVVTGKVDGSPAGADIDTSTLPYTGQVRKTLPALEEEYQADIDNFVQVSDQLIVDKTAEFDTSIANKEVEADAAIDSYRLLNKGPYAAGITLENKFEFVEYNGETYFAENPPYTTTSTLPDADVNLFIGGYTTLRGAADVFSNSNLLSNHNFLIPSPDDSQPAPSATPTSYPPGYQIFSGVFANETTGISNLTYIDGRVSFSGGDLYFAVPNTGAIARLTAAQLVASVADFDGKPRTRGVSFALVGDEYRVTVGVDALGDESANETLLGSVKFEQGKVATGHGVSYGVIASGSTTPRTLEERFSDVVNVLDFGADRTGATDSTDSIKSAINYIQSLSNDSGWKSVMPRLYIPYGTYLIEQSNQLFADLRKARINIFGDGADASVLRYTGASEEGKYMLNNSDQNTGFCTFTGLRFEGADSGYFFYSASDGSSQRWAFTECSFAGFDRTFNFEGSANDSENTWTRCTFYGFTHASAEYIFRYANTQSVNQRFYATDIEVFDCPLFYLERGTAIQYYQGSIIPSGTRASILKYDANSASSSFGPGNSPTSVFTGVRFEIRDGSRLIEASTKYAQTYITAVFTGCGMGGYNVLPYDAGDPYYPIEIHGAARVQIRDCGNFTGYRMSLTSEGNISANYNARFTITDTETDNEFFSETHVLVSPSTTNADRSPYMYLKRASDSYDGEWFWVKDSSKAVSIVGTTSNISNRSNSTIRGVYMSGGVATDTVTLPPSYLRSVKYYHVKSPSYGGSTLTITVYNADRSITLGTADVVSNSDDAVYEVVTRPYWINPFGTASERENIIVEYTHSYGSGVILMDGTLIVEH